MFDGAFAAVPIKEGELIEKGVMRRLPEGFDGNTCPYIFTWSNERPNKVRERHAQHAYAAKMEISCSHWDEEAMLSSSIILRLVRQMFL